MSAWWDFRWWIARNVPTSWLLYHRYCQRCGVSNWVNPTWDHHNWTGHDWTPGKSRPSYETLLEFYR